MEAERAIRPRGLEVQLPTISDEDDGYVALTRRIGRPSISLRDMCQYANKSTRRARVPLSSLYPEGEYGILRDRPATIDIDGPVAVVPEGQSEVWSPGGNMVSQPENVTRAILKGKELGVSRRGIQNLRTTYFWRWRIWAKENST